MANSVGHNLRIIRKLHGWTLMETAKGLGVTISTVQRVETGVIDPPPLAYLIDFQSLFRIKAGIVTGPKLIVKKVLDV